MVKLCELDISRWKCLEASTGGDCMQMSRPIAHMRCGVLWLF
jgi:hypothetical protein